MSIAGIGNVMAMNGGVASQGGPSVAGGNAGADFSALVNQLMNAEQKNKHTGLSLHNTAITLPIGVE